MPRGFAGKSVKKFFANTEEALDRASNAHNTNPFDRHRSNHSMPLPNLPPTHNQPAPFTAADAMSDSVSHARNVGDVTNIALDPGVVEDISYRMQRIDRQAADDMRRVADEVEAMCGTIFVVPETVERIRSLCDDFKRAMHYAGHVTDDAAMDVRKFVNEMCDIDHGNPEILAISRTGADQAIDRVSRSMDRQIQNMERTVDSYKNQSLRLSNQADRERRRAEQLSSLLQGGM